MCFNNEAFISSPAAVNIELKFISFPTRKIMYNPLHWQSFLVILLYVVHNEAFISSLAAVNMEFFLKCSTEYFMSECSEQENQSWCYLHLKKEHVVIHLWC